MLIMNDGQNILSIYYDSTYFIFHLKGLNLLIQVSITSKVVF